MKHKGDLIIEKNNQDDYSSLTEVAGNVEVRQGATLTAPALTWARNVYVRQGATLTAPALTRAGNVEVREGATLTAPALTWAGNVYVREGATLTAPALTGARYVEVRGKSFKHDFILKTIFLGKDYQYIAGGSLTADGKIYIRLGCYVRPLQEWDEDFWNNPSEFPNDKSEKSEKRLATFNKIKSYLTN